MLMDKEYRPGLISVVMPCFNAERFVEEAAKSALCQSYENVELIVVDDGSTDCSREILARLAAEFFDRMKVFHQDNKGPGPARNRGLTEARGAFIAFLDSDDFWDPNCIEKLHAALVNSSAQIAYCGWQNLGLSDRRMKPFIPPDYSKCDKFEILLGGCRWPIHAALTRRECIERVRGFNERWTSCMDYDLWLRLTPFVEIILVPEVLAFYMHHDGEQVTKNRARLAVNHWLIQCEFLKQHPDIARRLGRKRIRQLTLCELLKRAYICYWDRDLEAARTIFRVLMKKGYGTHGDWKYMLPSLLPLSLHKAIIRLFGGGN